VITHEALSALDRAVARLEDELARQPDTIRQTSFVARSLRESWPGATLSACLLRQARRHQLVTFDSHGRPDEEAMARLGDADVADHAAHWKQYLTPRGRSVLVSSDHAMLAVVLDPRRTSDAEEAVARLGLSRLSQVFTRHALRQRLLALEEEGEALEHLANAGELAGVLAHEFSDFLNMLLLNLAVLEYRLPETEHADLAEVRKHGNRAAELVGLFQQYRRAFPADASSTDLTEAVHGAVRRLAEETTEAVRIHIVEKNAPEGSLPYGEVALRLERGPDVPPVQGSAPDVRRLVRFLVSNAARAAALAGGQVLVATEAEDGRARLRVEDSAPLSEDEVGHLFTAASVSREGVDPLEMAACRSLARRLHAKLTAEGRPEGGARIVVEFGEAQASST
jgi:signal transduction histidine kinase